MHWALALVVKPFAALALFVPVFALVALADRLIPSGPVKTFLFKKR